MAQVSQSQEKATSEFIRQQERERQLREQAERQPNIHLETPASDLSSERLPVNEEPCFPIQSINLKGQEAERFQWALSAINPADDPAEGRCLGTQGINLVMKRLQNAIVAKGYVTTRVLAEPQNLNEGNLTLTIVPGRVHAIRLTNDSDQRARLSNALPIRPGDLLNLRDIEQGLENLKRVPTADADIQIVPAEDSMAKPGESDLVVTWRQALPLRLSLSLDDSGTKATGKNQGSATLSLDHVLTLNDLMYYTWNRDVGGSSPGERGTDGYVFHYSLPYDYWQLGFTTSQNNYYQSVAGINQTYRYSGESSNAELKLSRLLYRDAVRKSTVSLKAWLRTSNNYIDDTEVLVQRRRMAGWEAGLTHQDGFGRATVDINLAYRRGTGAFGSMPAPEEAFNEGTARPSFFTSDVQFRVPFDFADQHFQYRSNWRGQWNRSTLVPQDRFAIGGRYTVRGFDGENTLTGERGWIFRNEIGLSLGDLLPETYLALDHGVVDGPTSRLLVGKRLTGAALGWRGNFKGVSYDFFVAQPVRKPDRFTTPSTTTGFSLAWAF